MWYLLKRCFGGIRKEGPPMHDTIVAASEHVDPEAVLLDAAAREQDAERALARISEKYHEGTEALTVAQAKVQVMRRYPSYTGAGGTGGGEWHRKPR